MRVLKNNLKEITYNSKEWDYLKLELGEAHSNYRHYDEKIKSQINMMIGSWAVFISVLGVIWNLNAEIVLSTTLVSIALFIILMINYFLILDLKKSVMSVDGAYNAIIKIKKQMHLEKISIYEVNAPSLVLSQFSWINYIAFRICTSLWAILTIIYSLKCLSDSSIQFKIYVLLSLALFIISYFILKDYTKQDLEIQNVLNWDNLNEKKFKKELSNPLKSIFNKNTVLILQFLIILLLLAVIVKLLV